MPFRNDQRNGWTEMTSFNSLLDLRFSYHLNGKIRQKWQNSERITWTSISPFKIFLIDENEYWWITTINNQQNWKGVIHYEYGLLHKVNFWLILIYFNRRFWGRRKQFFSWPFFPIWPQWRGMAILSFHNHKLITLLLEFGIPNTKLLWKLTYISETLGISYGVKETDTYNISIINSIFNLLHY